MTFNLKDIIGVEFACHFFVQAFLLVFIASKSRQDFCADLQFDRGILHSVYKY